MKYTVLLAALTSAALAQDRTVWFHASLAIVAINKGIDTNEFWGEIDFHNTSQHPETLTMTARRYSGKQFLSETYTIDPGEKRTVRIEDPEANIEMADGYAGIIKKLTQLNPDVLKKMLDPELAKKLAADPNAARDSLYSIATDFLATVLIEPAPPGVSIELRQLKLHGDRLTTAALTGDHTRHPDTSGTTRVVPNGYENQLCLSNVSSDPKTVLICEGSLYCTSPSRRVNLPPFGTIAEHLGVGAALFVTNPAGVIVGFYHETEGISSMFHVNSGITFGAPVESPKKDK
jgi:hypothetical protein